MWQCKYLITNNALVLSSQANTETTFEHYLNGNLIHCISLSKTVLWKHSGDPSKVSWNQSELLLCVSFIKCNCRYGRGHLVLSLDCPNFCASNLFPHSNKKFSSKFYETLIMPRIKTLKQSLNFGSDSVTFIELCPMTTKKVANFQSAFLSLALTNFMKLVYNC